MASDHGGNVFEIARELNISPDEIVDLSSNVVDADLGVVRLRSRLPSEEPDELERLIEEKFSFQRNSVLVNAGTSQFIKDICCIFKNKKALILAPTYSEYEKQSRNFGLTVQYALSDEDNGFEFELEGINFSGFDVVFVCNPNNPTGVLLKKEGLLKTVKDNPNSFFVVDEAYMDFDFNRNSLLHQKLDNLCVLRSFSKLHGLAGLRIGWLYSSNGDFIEKLKALRPPWSVSEFALELAKAALDTDFTKRIEEIVNLRDYLIKRLKGFEMVRVFDSHANFVLFRLSGDPEDFFSYFKNNRLLLRSCENFYGLNKNFFRVSIKDRYSMELFLELLEGYFK
ncbi:pyridoxal phosphate-dependent aminotransferase [Hippea sp. KM1]|uniref:pyridoxal phosphate-dependent aminotransferase n=1 Tax=Hippea sp. KM1 TaxID=944481 RepID=UPI00046CC4FF|nr:aminotransferase class I/II-fold pyridoxal phosphate-dependent enzyme [Hippea sp. KM1]